jgi:hypothetical protein
VKESFIDSKKLNFSTIPDLKTVLTSYQNIKKPDPKGTRFKERNLICKFLAFKNSNCRRKQ